MTVEAETEHPKLLVFGSRRSGPCRKLDAHLAQVLQRRGAHNAFRLVRVDVDDRPDLAERFRISTVPTLLVVEGKSVRSRLAGLSGPTRIAEFLEPWLRRSPASVR